jgi:hypothetical protein
LRIDDDASHQHFQFLWIAIKRTEFRPTLYQTAVIVELIGRLRPLTKVLAGGACVPLRECELALSDEERALLLQMVGATPWEDVAAKNQAEPAEVVERAAALCRWLGADLVISTVLGPTTGHPEPPL